MDSYVHSASKVPNILNNDPYAIFNMLLWVEHGIVKRFYQKAVYII